MRKLLLLLFFSSQAWAVEELTCREHPAFVQCDIEIESENSLGDKAFVKVWRPRQITAETEVIVFLHGRGYSRLPGESGSMLEIIGIETILSSMAADFILVSPQDIFIQADSQERGQDYWIGSGGRNWESFLTTELRESLNRYYRLVNRPWKAIGISMGAHGAMKLAVDYPEHYKAFASISPVFRSILPEIPKEDYDIFLSRNGEIVNSLGARMLELKRRNIALRLPPHFIRIHKNDSFLSQESFPMANEVWNYLKSHSTSIQITEENDIPEGQGHSMLYWTGAFRDALTWLKAQ